MPLGPSGDLPPVSPDQLQTKRTVWQMWVMNGPDLWMSIHSVGNLAGLQGGNTFVKLFLESLLPAFLEGGHSRNKGPHPS